MSIALDHVFIITEPGAAVAERFKAIGWLEGAANTHPGQGTSNRRFFLDDFTVELLFISDPEEAANGTGKGLGILSRFNDPVASPFGMVVRVPENDSKPAYPGWEYYPDYFDGEMSFYVGNNSGQLLEPLCICMPPSLARPATQSANSGWQLTTLEIRLPVEKPSQVLLHFASMEHVKLIYGQAHHMTMRFNNGRDGQGKSFAPDLPLRMEW